MSWFAKKPVNERQQRSQEQIERGGLPLQAEERLLDLKGREKSFFTSSLTVNEFVLTASEGLRPLGQVMGSTVYHLGWQYPPYYTSGEMTVWGEAQWLARQLALSRMQQEAALLGAHGVIGVRMESKPQDWGQNLLEFTARGTAIAIGREAAASPPFLSALSAQDFWTLHRSGYRPVGVAFGACAFYQKGSAQTQYLRYYAGTVEITEYSRAVNEARQIAMNRLQHQANRYNAHGLVGVTVETDIRTTEVEINGQSRRDLIVQFTAVGTAIMAQAGVSPPIDYSVSLKE